MVFVRYSLFVIPQRHIHVPANTFHRDKPTGSHPPSVFLFFTHYSLFIERQPRRAVPQASRLLLAQTRCLRYGAFRLLLLQAGCLRYGCYSFFPPAKSNRDALLFAACLRRWALVRGRGVPSRGAGAPSVSGAGKMPALLSAGAFIGRFCISRL